MRDIRVEPPPLAVLTGKGRKTRHVPLGGNTTALLAAYLAEHGLDHPGHDDHPLFVSQHRSKLSRGGIAWILREYQAQATRHSPARPDPAHTAPQQGHAPLRGRSHCPTSATSSDTSTCPPPRSTLVPPTEAKRKALEATSTEIVTDDLPEWNQNPELLDSLASL